MYRFFFGARRLVTATILCFAILLSASTGRTEPMREFLMACTYGVLAGTMVGAATLAFTDKPGDNLNKIARGASIGLYMGIALGSYVVYGVPDSTSPYTPSNAPANPYPDDVRFKPSAPSQPLAFRMYPLLSEKGLDGAAMDMTLLRF